MPSTTSNDKKTSENDKPSTVTSNLLVDDILLWLSFGVVVYALVFLVSSAWHEGARL